MKNLSALWSKFGNQIGGKNMFYMILQIEMISPQSNLRQDKKGMIINLIKIGDHKLI